MFPTYFHVSHRDFKPGDVLQPGHAGHYDDQYPEGEQWRKDHVWLTSDYYDAHGWLPTGTVYEVRPASPVCEHVDLTEFDGAPEVFGPQFHTQSAVVVGRAHNPMDPDEDDEDD